jgi:hypothetical protein
MAGASPGMRLPDRNSDPLVFHWLIVQPDN